MSDLLSMGAYTFYVWASVGCVCIALGLMAWRTRLAFKRVQAELAWRHNAES